MKTLFTFILFVVSLAVLAQSKKTISTEIIIDASPEEVWKAITNNQDWKNWNPFIVNSTGKIEIGQKLENTHIMGDDSMVFSPKVIEYNEGVSYAWRGRFIMPGLVDGKHSFEIIHLNDGKVKLIHSEKFSGILSGTMMKKYGAETLDNFNKMNIALKDYVEAKSAHALR